MTVTWSEPLDEASVPTGAMVGFRVRIGSTNGPAVTAVAVAGDTTTLSLASAIADGTQDVTLEYTPPAGDKVQDAAGNTAAAIVRGSALDVGVTPDTRAPAVSGTPTVDGTMLVLTFDEALDPSSIPAAPGGLTVTVTRGDSPVTGFEVTALDLSALGHRAHPHPRPSGAGRGCGDPCLQTRLSRARSRTARPPRTRWWRSPERMQRAWTTSPRRSAP